MSTSFQSFTLPAGTFDAYVAHSVLPNGIALLLLPEIYNISGWIRNAAERYAGQGFDVLVPDLYWRQQAGLHLDYNPADQQTGRALAGALDRPQAVADLADTVSQWRAQLPTGTPVLAVGYCLGGELGLLAAAEGILDGVSAYYPTRLGEHLARMPHIHTPAQIHFGELDWRTPPELIQDIRSVADPDWIDIHVHQEADHGFGRFGHPPFHSRAAADAHRLTTALASRLVATTRA